MASTLLPLFHHLVICGEGGELPQRIDVGPPYKQLLLREHVFVCPLQFLVFCVSSSAHHQSDVQEICPKRLALVACSYFVFQPLEITEDPPGYSLQSACSEPVLGSGIALGMYSVFIRYDAARSSRRSINWVIPHRRMRYAVCAKVDPSPRSCCSVPNGSLRWGHMTLGVGTCRVCVAGRCFTSSVA